MKTFRYLVSFLVLCAACSERPSAPKHVAKTSPKAQDSSGISKTDKDSKPAGAEKETETTTPQPEGTNSGGDQVSKDSAEKKDPPAPVPEPAPVPLRFKALTFNVYTASAAEIAKSVIGENPEIACLQEASVAETKDAAKLLGEGWVAVVPPDGSEYSFVSRLPLVKSLGNTEVKRGVVGAVFRIGDIEAAFFCHHGNYPEFGAREYFQKKVDLDTAIAHEKKNRESQMKAVLSFVEPYKKQNMPVFIMGDFNTASHTDYEPTIAWPITMMIQSAGYGDSWRELNQATPRKALGQYLKTDPGITWYRLKREENDLYTRMDYIFYAGPVKPIETKTVDLAPSDHFSLYTIFQLN